MLDIFGTIELVFLFFFGSCIGSFLLVIADRYMSGENAFTGRSKCDFCKKKLAWYELIPFVSFLMQRGRCSSCNKKLSFAYFVYELISGLLCGALLYPVAITGDGIVGHILMYIVACVLLILIRIDFALMLLPDRFIGMLIILAIVISMLGHQSVSDIAFGLLVGVGFLYALWAGTGGAGIGFGDVKLMIPLGILFGFRGTVTLLFTAFFIGGIVGIILLSMKKAGAKTAIPFGPFLALSAFALMVIPDLSHRFFQLLGVE